MSVTAAGDKKKVKSLIKLSKEAYERVKKTNVQTLFSNDVFTYRRNNGGMIITKTF